MTGTVQEMVAHNRARYAVENYGQGNWVIVPLSGRSHPSEHSERFPSLGTASQARDRGDFLIKVWGDEFAPEAKLTDNTIADIRPAEWPAITLHCNICNVEVSTMNPVCPACQHQIRDGEEVYVPTSLPPPH